MTRFRRPNLLWAAWSSGKLVAGSPGAVRCDQLDGGHLDILRACATWATIDQIGEALDQASSEKLRGDVEFLYTKGLLESSDDSTETSRPAFWRPWAPALGYHQVSKDVPYVRPGERVKIVLYPEPSPLKEYPGAAQRDLAVPDLDGDLRAALEERRTWRRFGAAPVSADDLATLLGLTFGVQHWMEFDGIGRQALKTSPSGGARHSIQAYVGVRHVEGVDPGVYHYDPERHSLSTLTDRFSSEMIERWLPTQHFSQAGVVVFLASMFERVAWRYPDPAAYRVVLIEAGHLGQTFCLLATRLGLAPFCTAALAEREIEPILGIDGVTESVVYALGVGSRPGGEALTALPDGMPQPKLALPAWKQEKDRFGR